MNTQILSTILLISALPPIIYLILASWNVKRFFNNPTRTQVYSVLRYRYHLTGLSLLIWLAGVVVFYMNPAAFPWLDDLTGILFFLLTAAGLFMTGCVMFPAVREAEFLAPEEMKSRLSPDDPVIGLEINGEARAYPIEWIQQAQIVEDFVGGLPIVVTYCKPCKMANAFIIEYEGKSLRLIFPPHQDDKVMLYDAISKRLIQQHSGEIIFGYGTGQRLPMIPVRILPWITWETNHPDTRVYYHPPADKQSFSLSGRISALLEELKIMVTNKENKLATIYAKLL